MAQSLRISWIAVSIVACVGCAPRTTAPTPTPKPIATPSPAASNSRYEKLLNEARRLRALAETHQPPAHEPFADEAAALAFIKRELSEWIRVRRQATERAETAYDGALAVASADQAPTVLLESAAVVQAFADAFVAATMRAAPPSIRSSPELLATYRNAALATVDETYARARERLGRCSSDARCRVRLARLPKTKTPTTADPNPWKDELLVAPVRAAKPTTSPRPCSHAGTLRARSTSLFESASAKTAMASFDRIDVDDTTPSSNDGRVRVKSVWPIVGEVWLDAAAMPFALRKKQELVPGQIWLDRGARVRARLGDAGRMIVSRPVPSGTTPTIELAMACADLALAGSIDAPPLPQQRKLLGTIDVEGPVALHARPNGPRIGSISEAFSADVTARRGDWLRVSARASAQDPAWGGYIPFDFDAWIPESSGTMKGGLVGVLVAGDRKPPTHTTARAIDLYTAPKDSAPTLKLAADVPLLAGARQSGFVAVKIPDLYPPHVGTSFWIRESALVDSMTAASR